MGRTKGIHAIWTTYGTWLPGDARGHWSALFDFYGHVLQHGQQLNSPDATTRTRATSSMHEPEKALNEDEIRLVKTTLEDYIAPGMPGETWRIHATAIERTHVHLLFGSLNDPIGEVVGRIKSRTSSALLKLPANQNRRRIWSTGYWKVFLFEDNAMTQVARYIDAHGGRRTSRAAAVRRVEDPSGT